MEKIAQPVIMQLDQLDPNGIYSYADYLTWKFEQTVELIRGRIFPMAGPARLHQKISREICHLFYLYFKGKTCEFYNAPFDVRLYNRNKSVKRNKDVYTVVQPDICIICDQNKLDAKGCLGAPDLMVEILSPGNSTREMRIKKNLYEESGVREYWIVDPEHETIFQFHLMDNGVFSPATIYTNDETLTSAAFPDFKLEIKEIFKD